MEPDDTREWPLPHPYDFTATVRLLRTGPRDPTARSGPNGWWRTTWTEDGPATVCLSVGSESMVGRAWGDGAAAALDGVPEWTGLETDPWNLPEHPVVDRLFRRFPGLRDTNTGNVFEALVPTILQQLVTWEEATEAWRRICLDLGDPAPGPQPLRLPPTPDQIRAAGASRLQAAGALGKQARTLIDCARSHRALQKAAAMTTTEANQWLQKVRGVGPWTSGFVLGGRLGRPEPIPHGDVHLPHTVAWALARERWGSDERMNELLEPFAGQGFRVIKLITLSGVRRPGQPPGRARPHRRGPRG